MQTSTILDDDKERKLAKATPYEFRVQRLLSGPNQIHRVTVVLDPAGFVRFLPVHRFNAGYVCGGDHPLRAEDAELDAEQNAISWNVSIRPTFAKLGWRLYRDFLRDQPDGEKYEKLLDAVLVALKLGVDGRPTAKMKLSKAQRDGYVHPKLHEMRKLYSGNRRLADLSVLDQLFEEMGIEGGVDMSPENLEAEKERLRKQLAPKTRRRVEADGPEAA